MDRKVEGVFERLLFEKASDQRDYLCHSPESNLAVLLGRMDSMGDLGWRLRHPLESGSWTEQEALSTLVSAGIWLGGKDFADSPLSSHHLLLSELAGGSPGSIDSYPMRSSSSVSPDLLFAVDPPTTA